MKHQPGDLPLGWLIFGKLKQVKAGGKNDSCEGWILTRGRAQKNTHIIHVFLYIYLHLAYFHGTCR